MSIAYSEIESKRFGLRVYRGQYESFDIVDIENIIRGGNFDVIIVRYPTETINEHFRIACFENCKTIHADSLVYYVASLQNTVVEPLHNNLCFEIMTPATDGCLDAMVGTIFSGYQNHYFANPCLQKKAILDGYIEWAKSYARFDEGRIAWLVKDGVTDKPLAFATCSCEADGSKCAGILYGVMPGASGRGIYADLIRFTQGYFKNLGVDRMTVSTQLQNYKVQKVWNSHGFKLDHSYETYHIINQSLWEKCKNEF